MLGQKALTDNKIPGKTECIDLMSDKATEGDFLIRDESISGDFVLS